MPAPHFTLIICTYHRAGLLTHCLRALAEQPPPGLPWELLVIDNNSPDDTRRVTEQFFQNHPEIDGRCITETQAGAQPRPQPGLPGGPCRLGTVPRR